ncbi:MAG TPA: hypothetical protein VGM82_12885 [Gemmatimonadaceae bacterium]
MPDPGSLVMWIVPLAVRPRFHSRDSEMAVTCGRFDSADDNSLTGITHL